MLLRKLELEEKLSKREVLLLKMVWLLMNPCPFGSIFLGKFDF